MQSHLKIGITISDGQRISPSTTLWSSGLIQNIVFLALLLQKLETVDSVYLVKPNGSNDQPNDRLLGAEFGISEMTMSEGFNSLDVIIEFGVRVADDFAIAYKSKGGRLVSYMAGNTMIMNMEQISSGLPYGEMISNHAYDACWITPQHYKTNEAYVRLTRTPYVYSAPHIWDPIILLKSLGRRDSFCWSPDSVLDGWKIACFDPNVNFIKTFHLPLLVCEQAYRLNPQLLKHVFLFSANQFIGQTHFEEFVGATDLGRSHKVTAEPRFVITDVLGVHANAVVTHQWENGLNYLYWDALFGGFPLIHNSEFFKDVGYYYPEFDPQTGGKVLSQSLMEHSKNFNQYCISANQFLKKFSIDNFEVRAAYAKLLESLYEDHSHRHRLQR